MQYQFATFSTSWNVIVILGVGVLFKKNYGAWGCRGPWIFDIPIDIIKQFSLFAGNKSFGLPKQSSQKSWTRLIKLLTKPWKIRVKEFIFRTCKFTKNELFLGYFSRILFKSLRGLLSQNTSLYNRNCK